MSKRMNVMVWKVDERHDRIAPVSACGIYEFLGVRRREDVASIDRTVLEIGAYVFKPGLPYRRFGSNKKTAAGFVCYDGEPVLFVGTWNGYALFSPVDRELEPGEYEALFYSWIYDKEQAAFFTTNSAGGGRIMELNALPTGERKWKGREAARREI